MFICSIRKESVERELQSIDERALYEMIRNPTETFKKRVKLESSREKEKHLLHKQEPYIVCGAFYHQIIANEYFAYIENFIVSVKLQSLSSALLEDLYSRLQQDHRILMYYKSSEEYSLNLIFKLKKRCYDSGMFAMFYRAFVSDFVQQYQIEQFVDYDVPSVTASYFLNHDPDVFFRPEAIGVRIDDFISLENLENTFTRDYYLLHQSPKRRKAKEEVQMEEPNQETLDQIKSILGKKGRLREKVKCSVFLPNLWEGLFEDWRLALKWDDIEVLDIQDIKNGKKVKLCSGLRTSEINFFYTQQGILAVESPKQSCSSDLNKKVVEHFRNFLRYRCSSEKPLPIPDKEFVGNDSKVNL